jgi:excinuclease UvrABC nuclease subunit
MTERSRISKLLRRLHRQPLRRFPALHEQLDAPNAQGVYVLRDPKRKVLHVGRTLRGKNGLRQRLKNHLNAASSFVIAHLRGNGKRLRSGYTFQYLEVPNSRERILLEYAATVWHCPKHLGDGAGVPK